MAWQGRREGYTVWVLALAQDLGSALAAAAMNAADRRRSERLAIGKHALFG